MPATRTHEGLLGDYLSEEELAVELDKTVRTVQRWRKLGIGPPFVKRGKTPDYHREKTRQWLAAGGTAGKANEPARAQRRRSLRRSASSI
jgi:hypothetical protein